MLERAEEGAPGQAPDYPMERWKNGSGRSWRKGDVAGATGDDAEQAHLMPSSSDEGEGDQYLKPALRYAVAEEKRHYRCMAAMTVSSFLVLVCIGICIAILLSRDYVKACPVCSSVESAMDRAVDPCEDFYQFSCGRWQDTVEIPAGHSKWGSFGQVYSQIQELLRKVLEGGGYEYKDQPSTALRKAKDFYKACMNESAQERAGSEPLKQLLRKLGGWSMLPPDTPGIPNWEEGAFDLTHALVTAQLKGASPLIDIGLSPDAKNSSNNIMQFHQSGTGFAAPELYSDNVTTHEEAYASLGAKVVVLLSLGDSESVDVSNITRHPSYEPALQRMNEIVEFEANLSRIFVPKDELEDPVKMYNKMTLREMDEIIPQINISRLLNEVFAADIPLDEMVLVPTSKYFLRLNGLLATTPNRLLADYITWNVVETVLEFMPKIYQDIVLEFNSVFSGSNTTRPRWERCVREADSGLSYVTGALFVQEVATPLLRNESRDLIHYIVDAFINNLPSVSWMDEATKMAARDKALAVEPKIGFPPWIEDPVLLDEHYETLNITSGSHFQNIQNLRDFYVGLFRKKLGKPVEKARWHMSPTDVNAYYSASANEIVFPLSILLSPYYDSTHPMSMNFGAIGMVMGHEFSHGFDNHGRKYDLEGNLRDWWGNSSALAYENRTQCMVQQYSSYRIGDSHLNGEYTLAENIADNGGLKIAHRAFRAWQGAHNESRRLEALGMSEEQLFFLGFSQMWCTYVTRQFAQMSVLTDSHSAEQYRVNGAVSNMVEFAEAYSCPQGYPMNPARKCEVW